MPLRMSINFKVMIIRTQTRQILNELLSQLQIHPYHRREHKNPIYITLVILKIKDKSTVNEEAFTSVDLKTFRYSKIYWHRYNNCLEIMDDIYVYKQTKRKSGSFILDVSTCCLTGRDKIPFLQELIPF